MSRMIKRLPPIVHEHGRGGLTWWGFTLLIVGCIAAAMTGPIIAGMIG